MTDAPLTPREDDAALAGEYVLGVLDAAERAQVEARMRMDGAFAAEIQAWERRFAGMNEDFAEAPVPADMLPRIEARIFGRAAPDGRGRGWIARLLLGGALAAVLVLGAFLGLRPALGPSGPVLTAAIEAEDAALAYAARYAEGTLTVTRTAGAAAPEGQVHELWIIVGEAAPVSLGLLEQASFSRPLAELPEGAVLAVTLEPAGGAPGGVPTGPVVAAGPAQL